MQTCQYSLATWRLKRLLQVIPLVGLVSLCFSSTAIACDEKCATQVANREVQRLGLDLRELEIKVDDGNKRWERFMAYSKQSPDEGTKMLYEEYNAKLEGKTFWVIYFSLQPVKGTYPKGGGATVLIDKRASEPVLVIRGEQTKLEGDKDPYSRFKICSSTKELGPGLGSYMVRGKTPPVRRVPLN